MELNEKLIEEIVRRVLAQLKSGEKKKVLTIYTGGSIASKQALKELKKISKQAIDFSLIFTDSAKEISNPEEIKNILGVENILTGKKAYSKLKEFDLILVPVLSQNSAAKLANHITDNLATNMIFEGLLLGIPVLATKNAADLTDKARIDLKMDQATDALLDKNKENLARLVDYGVKLVDVTKLAEQAEAKLFKPVKKEQQNNYLRARMDRQVNNTKRIDLEKKVLTYSDLRSFVAAGRKEIVIKNSTIITPLAKEFANQNGVSICSQQR